MTRRNPFALATLSLLTASLLTGCLTAADESGPPSAGDNNGVSNNGTSNNGTSNNGANNGTTNNGAANNGANNNGTANNGTANNGDLDAGMDVDDMDVDDASTDVDPDTTADDVGEDVEPDAACPPGTSEAPDGECRTPEGCLYGEHDGGDGSCLPAGVCIDGLMVDGQGVCVGPDGCRPGLHDGGDGQCVNAGTCLSGFHDGGDGRCLRDGECIDGFHDGGDGACIALGTCASGYHDGGDGACQALGVCSANHHDGGDGTCVVLGECVGGYRDGGDGTCVSQSQCADGYHDGGDGSCVVSGQCADGYHDGGTGQCVRAGTCTAGYVDGGDGACVPRGECSSGYATSYRDADQDGVGAGPSLGCSAVPPATGLSLEGTDCDDTDASVHRLLEVYPEYDGDGYTAPRVERCVGEHPAANELLAPVRPPSIGFYPSLFVVIPEPSSPEPWRQPENAARPDQNGARCRRPERDCGALVVGDFHAQVPPNATITGVRVHVLRSRSGGSTDTTIERRVQLGRGGMLIGDNKASTEQWPQGDSEAVYGGPTDLWGTTLTPADLDGLAVVIEMNTATKNSTEPEIDYVWMEVFHDKIADCDDDDPMAWTPIFGHRDADDDGFGEAMGQVFCVSTWPGPLASNGDDCDDGNASARPNQTGYFTTARTSGSFDYNCDELIEVAPITTATACGLVGTVCSVTSSVGIEEAPCGQPNPVSTCGFNTVSQCVSMSSSRSTSCR